MRLDKIKNNLLEVILSNCVIIIQLLLNNVMVFIILICSILYSTNYVANNNNANKWDALYAISLSYIAAVIIYVLQILIPGIRRTEVVNRVLKVRLNSIINGIDKLYNELDKLYVCKGENDGNIDKFEQIQKRFSLNGITSISNIKKVSNIFEISNKENKKSVRECVCETIYGIKENIDFLYKTFPDYLSNETIDILEDINTSEFVSMFSFIFQMHPYMDFRISVDDYNLFEDFWKLKEELKLCKEKIK